MKSLSEALDEIAVCECAELNEACERANMGSPHPEGWWAVVTDDAGGAIAYFAEERAAFEHRLFLINQMLNGPSAEKEPDQC